MSELRNRGPERPKEQHATGQRPDAVRGRFAENTRTAPERLRAPHPGRPWVSPRGDTAQLRDSRSNRDAAARAAGPADALRRDGGGDVRAATRGGDSQRGRDTLDRNEIDPRLLAGVPRPRAALPDDTGRAYLTHPREANRSEGRDGLGDKIRAGNASSDGRHDGDRGDRLHAWVDRPAFQDPHGDIPPPDRYGDPLTLPDGSRIPRFNDRPTREQTAQGRLRDCGIVATLGAVAFHRPGEIARRVAIEADGTYRVRLNEAQWTEHGAEPTGRIVELSVTPDLPVYDSAPDQPAFAKPEAGAAWSPILEKAIAGVDQTWTPSRCADWAESWALTCQKEVADKELRTPRSGPPPDGYVRLNQGSSVWDRAELLTQLTGKESIVRSLPERGGDMTRVLAGQLDERKPVLVASRPERHDGEVLPHRLESSHVYEVVSVDGEMIRLRNPWNFKHPEPMITAEFAENMKHAYTTLK